MVRRIQTIFSIAAILMFVGLAFSPTITAQKSLEAQPKLTILLKGVNDEDRSFEIEITEEQINQINLTINNCLDVFNASTEEGSLEGKNITRAEWNEIKISTFEIIDSIKNIVGDDFPDQDVKNYISTIFGSLLRTLWYLLHPIVSVGLGVSLIPFYDYETFIGKLLRPVYITYFAGFSASIRTNPFPPPIPYCKIGLHRIRTLFFDGIFINFRDLGIKRIIGPQLLIGCGITIMT